MTLLINPNTRVGVSTVQDLTVLVVANVWKFIVVWSLVMAAFVSYAFLQTPKYHYSTVVKLPELLVKGQPKQLVSGSDLVEYLNNVTLPGMQLTAAQKPLVKKLKFSTTLGSNLVVISADVPEDEKISTMLDFLANDALKYALAEEQAIQHSHKGELSGLSTAQIVTPTQRGQNPINLGSGVLIILGFLFATSAGVMTVVLSAFSKKVCIDVRRLKAEHAAENSR